MTGPTEELALPRRYGAYELLERMGQGAMAEIYRARRPGVAGFERYVVVKRLLPALAADPRYVALFINEAKLAAEIQHKNVVQVLELGRSDEGELFIAMEDAGVDLARLLAQAKAAGMRVPPWLTVHIVGEVLEALAYAYDLVDATGRARHVVHRDVAPSNVFVSLLGDVKLGDFGIAKDDARRDEPLTAALNGTLEYMAPEILAGAPADHRSDLFAAGVVLWEGLTERRLFAAPTAAEVKRRVWRAPRMPPSLIAPDVPPALDDLVLQTLEVDPERRPSSARELAAHLQEILGVMHASRQLLDVRSAVGAILSTASRAPIGDTPPPTRGAPPSTVPQRGRATSSKPAPSEPTRSPATSDPNLSARPGLADAKKDPTRETADLRPPPRPRALGPEIDGLSEPERSFSGEYSITPSSERVRTPTGEYSRIPTAELRRPPTGEAQRPPTGEYPRPPTGEHPRPSTSDFPRPVPGPRVPVEASRTPTGEHARPVDPARPADPARSADPARPPSGELLRPSALGGETTYAIINPRARPKPPIAAEPSGVETMDVIRTPPALRAPMPAGLSSRETKDILRPRPPSPPPGRDSGLEGSVPSDSGSGGVPWSQAPAPAPDEPTTDRLWEPYRGPHPFWLRGGKGFALGPCSFEEAVLTLRSSRARATIQVSGDGERWMPAPRFAELTGEEAATERPLAAVLYSGTLERTSTTAIFGRLAAERATGRLEIRRRTERGEEHASLHVADGRPVHIATNARGFTLYEVVLAEGDIAPADVAACMHALVTTGRPLEELVVERRCVDLETVRPRVMRARLALLLGWDWGTYSFFAEPARAEPPFAPALLPLVPRLLARARTADRLRVELGPIMDARLARTPTFEATLDQLELDLTEREGIAPFGATRSLREAILYSDAGERFALTMAYVLKELGALRVETSAPSRA